jgi:Zn-dependent protease
MHYIVAKKLRYHAYFVSYDQMLLLSIAVSFMGVIFLAPGAVIVEHIRSRKDHGLIALAGPATNVVLGLFCLALSVYVHPFFLAGFVINSLLAFFNMLPILGLDGQAIWHWNKVVYVVSAVVVLGIYGFAMFGL